MRFLPSSGLCDVLSCIRVTFTIIMSHRQCVWKWFISTFSSFQMQIIQESPVARTEQLRVSLLLLLLLCRIVVVVAVQLALLWLSLSALDQKLHILDEHFFYFFFFFVANTKIWGAQVVELCGNDDDNHSKRCSC